MKINNVLFTINGIRRSRVFLCYISWVTIFLFSLSQISLLAAPALFPTEQIKTDKLSTQTVSNIKDAVQSLLDLSLPPTMGFVQNSYHGASDKIVIYLQDSHGNMEAQKNIVEILKRIKKTAGSFGVRFKNIAVEGAEGKVQDPVLSSHPEKEVKKQVADLFLKKGIINGSEYYSVACDNDIELFGIETRDLYFFNLDEFQKTVRNRSGGVEELNSLIETAGLLEKEICSESLQEYLVKLRGFENGSVSLYNAALFFSSLAEKKGLDKKQYPQLNYFIDSLELSKLLDTEKIENQTKLLVETLGESLVKEDMSRLIKRSLDLRLGRISRWEYYAYLQNQSEIASINLEAKFPQVFKYCRLLEIQASIDQDALFDQIESITEMLLGILSVSEEEKKLIRIEKDLQQLHRLLMLKMSRSDFELFQKRQDIIRPEQYVSFFDDACSRYTSQEIKKTECKQISSTVLDAESFYKTALKRDDSLSSNMLSFIENRKLNILVLVTGGFHTEGIVQRIREKGLSCVVIAPRVSSSESDRLYLNQIMNKKDAFAQYLASIGTRLAAPTQLLDGFYQEKVRRGISTEYAAQAYILAEIMTFEGLLPDNFWKKGGRIEERLVQLQERYGAIQRRWLAQFRRQMELLPDDQSDRREFYQKVIDAMETESVDPAQAVFRTDPDGENNLLVPLVRDGKKSDLWVEFGSRELNTVDLPEKAEEVLLPAFSYGKWNFRVLRMRIEEKPGIAAQLRVWLFQAGLHDTINLISSVAVFDVIGEELEKKGVTLEVLSEVLGEDFSADLASEAGSVSGYFNIMWKSLFETAGEARAGGAKGVLDIQTIEEYSKKISEDIKKAIKICNKLVAWSEANEVRLQDSKLAQYLSIIQINELELCLEILEEATSGELSDEKEETDFGDMVSKVIMSYASVEGLDIQVDDSISRSPPVLVNSRHIRQVLKNIVKNAARAVPEGKKGQLKVEFRYLVRLQRMVVSVTDNGSGMDPVVLKNIFIPGFTTKDEPGHGLGLAFSKELIEHNEGFINAESWPGQGSRFTISFPVSSGPHSIKKWKELPELLKAQGVTRLFLDLDETVFTPESYVESTPWLDELEGIWGIPPLKTSRRVVIGAGQEVPASYYRLVDPDAKEVLENLIASGIEVVGLTARPDAYRKSTMEILEQENLPQFPVVFTDFSSAESKQGNAKMAGALEYAEVHGQTEGREALLDDRSHVVTPFNEDSDNFVGIHYAWDKRGTYLESDPRVDLEKASESLELEAEVLFATSALWAADRIPLDERGEFLEKTINFLKPVIDNKRPGHSLLRTVILRQISQYLIELEQAELETETDLEGLLRYYFRLGFGDDSVMMPLYLKGFVSIKAVIGSEGSNYQMSIKIAEGMPFMELDLIGEYIVDGESYTVQSGWVFANSDALANDASKKWSEPVSAAVKDASEEFGAFLKELPGLMQAEDYSSENSRSRFMQFLQKTSSYHALVAVDKDELVDNVQAVKLIAPVSDFPEYEGPITMPLLYAMTESGLAKEEMSATNVSVLKKALKSLPFSLEQISEYANPMEKDQRKAAQTAVMISALSYMQHSILATGREIEFDKIMKCDNTRLVVKAAIDGKPVVFKVLLNNGPSRLRSNYPLRSEILKDLLPNVDGVVGVEELFGPVPNMEVQPLVGDGTTVEDVIKRLSNPFGDITGCIEKAVEIAETVERLHDSGIYHRDVHVGNLFLDTEGSLFLGDFELTTFNPKKINKELPQKLNGTYPNGLTDAVVDTRQLVLLVCSMLSGKDLDSIPPYDQLSGLIIDHWERSESSKGLSPEDSAVCRGALEEMARFLNNAHIMLSDAKRVEVSELINNLYILKFVMGRSDKKQAKAIADTEMALVLSGDISGKEVSGFQPVVRGRTYGKIRIIKDMDFNPDKVEMLNFLRDDEIVVVRYYPANDPWEMAKPAGMITTRGELDSEDDLSHAKLRAQDWGVPYGIHAEAMDDLSAIDGKWALLEVGQDGVTRVRPANKREVLKWLSSAEYLERNAPFELPQPDLSEKRAAIPLSDLKVNAADRVGLKAAKLGELEQNELPVPPGLAIPFSVYNKVDKSNNLRARIQTVFEKLDFNDRASIAEHTGQIRDIIENARIPEELLAEIVSLVNETIPEEDGVRRLAVRSSTNSEDLPGFSGAGLHGSFLNVIGDDSLVDHIKKVWASVWSEEAVLTRYHKRIDHFQVYPGVIVQQAIEADASGVVTTADIRSGKRNVVVIDAGLGPGAVTEQRGITERFVFNKETGKLVKPRRIPEIRSRLKFISDGGTEEARVPRDQQSNPVLSPDKALETMKLAGKIADMPVLSDVPQDIEFFEKDGKIWIVQTRDLVGFEEKTVSEKIAAGVHEETGRILPDHWKTVWPVPSEEIIEEARSFWQNLGKQEHKHIESAGIIFDRGAIRYFTRSLKEPENRERGAAFIEALYFVDPEQTVRMLRGAGPDLGGFHSIIADYFKVMRKDFALTVLDGAMPDITNLSAEDLDYLKKSEVLDELMGIVRIFAAMNTSYLIQLLDEMDDSALLKAVAFIGLFPKEAGTTELYLAIASLAETSTTRMHRLRSGIPAAFTMLHKRLSQLVPSHWDADWPVPEDEAIAEAREFYLDNPKRSDGDMLFGGRLYSESLAERINEKLESRSGEQAAELFEALYFVDPERTADILRGYIIKGPHTVFADCLENLRGDICLAFVSEIIPDSGTFSNEDKPSLQGIADGLNRIYANMEDEGFVRMFNLMDDELAIRFFNVKGDFEEQIDRLILHWGDIDIQKMQRIKTSIPVEYSPVHNKLNKDIPSHWRTEWLVPEEAALADAERLFASLETVGLKLGWRDEISGVVFDHEGAKEFGLKHLNERDIEDVSDLFYAMYFTDPVRTIEIVRAVLFCGGPHAPMAKVFRGLRTEMVVDIFNGVFGKFDDMDEESLERLKIKGMGLWPRLLTHINPRWVIEVINGMDIDSLNGFLRLAGIYHKSVVGIVDGLLDEAEDEFDFERLTAVLDRVPESFERFRSKIAEALSSHWDSSWQVPSGETLEKARNFLDGLRIVLMIQKIVVQNGMNYNLGAADALFTQFKKEKPFHESLSEIFEALYFIDPEMAAEIFRGALVRGPHKALAAIVKVMRGDIARRFLSDSIPELDPDGETDAEILRTSWILPLFMLYLYFEMGEPGFAEFIEEMDADTRRRTAFLNELAKKYNMTNVTWGEMKGKDQEYERMCSIVAFPEHWDPSWSVPEDDIMKEAKIFLEKLSELRVSPDRIEIAGQVYDTVGCNLLFSHLLQMNRQGRYETQGPRFLEALFYKNPEKLGGILRGAVVTGPHETISNCLAEVRTDILLQILSEAVPPAYKKDLLQNVSFGSVGWGVGKLLDYMSIDRVADLFKMMEPELAARLLVLTAVFSQGNVIKAWEQAGLDVVSDALEAVPEISPYVRKLGWDKKEMPDHWNASWPEPEEDTLALADDFLSQKKAATVRADEINIEGQVYDIDAKDQFSLFNPSAMRDSPENYARLLEALYYRDPDGTIQMLRAFVFTGGPHKISADILNNVRTDIAAVFLESILPDVSSYAGESIDKLRQVGGDGLFRFLKLLSPELFIEFLNKMEEKSPRKLFDYIDVLHPDINKFSNYFKRIVDEWTERFPGELTYLGTMVPARYDDLRIAIQDRISKTSSTKVRRGQYALPQPVVSEFLEELEKIATFRDEKNIRTFLLKKPFRKVIEYNGQSYSFLVDPAYPSARVTFTSSDGVFIVSDMFVCRDKEGTRYMNGLLYAFYRHAPPAVKIQEAAHEHLERLIDERLKTKVINDFSDKDWQSIADFLVELLALEGHSVPDSFREILNVSWTAENIRAFLAGNVDDAGHKTAELVEKVLTMVFHSEEYVSDSGVFSDVEPAAVERRVEISDLDKFLEDVTERINPYLEKDEALSIVEETLAEVFDSLSSWTETEKKRVSRVVLDNTVVLDERPWFERGLLAVWGFLGIAQPDFSTRKVSVKATFFKGGNPRIRINLYNMRNPRLDVRTLVAGEVIRQTNARSMKLRMLQRDKLADALVLFMRSFGDRDILLENFIENLIRKNGISDEQAVLFREHTEKLFENYDAEAFSKLADSVPSVSAIALSAFRDASFACDLVANGASMQEAMLSLSFFVRNTWARPPDWSEEQSVKAGAGKTVDIPEKVYKQTGMRSDFESLFRSLTNGKDLDDYDYLDSYDLARGLYEDEFPARFFLIRDVEFSEIVREVFRGSAVRYYLRKKEGDSVRQAGLIYEKLLALYRIVSEFSPQNTYLIADLSLDEIDQIVGNTDSQAHLVSREKLTPERYLERRELEIMGRFNERIDKKIERGPPGPVGMAFKLTGMAVIAVINLVKIAFYRRDWRGVRDLFPRGMTVRKRRFRDEIKWISFPDRKMSEGLISNRIFDLLYEQGFEITRPLQIKRRYWISEKGIRKSRGMLRQYIAIDHHRGRKVMIKLVEDSKENVRHILGSDLEEHPNVMIVYDAGSLGKAGQFAAVDFVEGKDLTEWFSEEKEHNVQEGYNLAVQLFSGLNHLHSNRIIHGDIHSDNIRITPGGILKILDLNSPHSKLVSRDKEMLPDIYRAGRMAFKLLSVGKDAYTANGVFEEFDENRAKEFLLDVAGGDVVLAESLFDFFHKVAILRTDPEAGYHSIKDMLRDFSALQDRIAAVPEKKKTQRTARPLTGRVMSSKNYSAYKALAKKLASDIVKETDIELLQENMPSDGLWSETTYTRDELLSLISGDISGVLSVHIVDAFLKKTFEWDPGRTDDLNFKVDALINAMPTVLNDTDNISLILLERIDLLMAAKDRQRINDFLNRYGEAFLENSVRQAVESAEVSGSIIGRIEAVFAVLKETSSLIQQADNGTPEEKKKALSAMMLMQLAGVPLVKISGDIKLKNSTFSIAFAETGIEDECSVLFDMRFISDERLENALQMRRSLERKGVRVKWIWASDQYNWKGMKHILAKYDNAFRKFGVDFTEEMHIDTSKPWDSDKQYTVHVTEGLRELGIDSKSLMVLAKQASYERFYSDLGISIEIVNRMMASSESLKIELTEEEYTALTRVLSEGGKDLLDMAKVYRKNNVWILEVDPLAVTDSEFFDRVYKTMSAVAKMA
ncbi:MAG: PEP/pyruvate-binding domain-containing protein [Candidatus Theseobacter exili]|nr:PEP/pyruvate-binding domain-containing protein [Candidatus Theseobacter exili]